ncbi:putative ribosome-binding factor A, mitochondrial isoform X1 [Neoarius graeffei]|uniref:putative ribosome-binding factor A, mitochondrial isoform X1 n=1 Tax=Neoarius graeffei TaxID=443677 RepID=UPI00298CAA5D|nr:putative ribosome-binding factor A, mitochondrial isoform X1 [Neoarius graeffei]
MMFVLNSHHWIQKCLLPRHAGAVVSTMRQIRLETYIKSDRHQDMSLRRTFPHQSLGVTNLHTSAGVCRDLLKKMLTNKRKKKWYKAPQSVLTGQTGFMKPAKKRSLEDSLRVRTLNTILYKSISDLLSSHEVHAQLPSYNVEITKVSLLADYTVCRIYWKTSLSSDQDSQIQQILDKCAPRIRYLLISQQILGSVPPLVFILDKQYAALKEVENLLNIADYGPSDDSENLVLNGKDAETSVHTVEKKRFVFGIDHDALYKQIEDYKQRSSSSSSEISNSASLTQEQLDTLAEIRKQKLVEKKKRKAKKLKDDDITPKEFLLMRQLQKEQDEQYRTEYDTEDSQASERT